MQLLSNLFKIFETAHLFTVNKTALWAQRIMFPLSVFSYIINKAFYTPKISSLQIQHFPNNRV